VIEGVLGRDEACAEDWGGLIGFTAGRDCSPPMGTAAVQASAELPKQDSYR
jgi:hypothetical protein